MNLHKKHNYQKVGEQGYHWQPSPLSEKEQLTYLTSQIGCKLANYYLNIAVIFRFSTLLSLLLIKKLRDRENEHGTIQKRWKKSRTI